MSPIDTLLSPDVSPSKAWAVFRELSGTDDIETWEPDTIAHELQHRGVPPTAGLMTKLLGAQTVVTTGVVSWDHEALFAFALACAGVAHSASEFAHPPVALLAYALQEIGRLRPGADLAENHDPDEIAPAVAVLLHDEGFVVAPRLLEFAQDSLDRLSHASSELKEKIRTEWAKVSDKPDTELRRVAESLPEDEVGVQVRRLGDVVLFLRHRATLDMALSRPSPPKTP